MSRVSTDIESKSLTKGAFMSDHQRNRQGPLAGLRIVDFTRVLGTILYGTLGGFGRRGNQGGAAAGR